MQNTGRAAEFCNHQHAMQGYVDSVLVLLCRIQGELGISTPVILWAVTFNVSCDDLCPCQNWKTLFNTGHLPSQQTSLRR